MNRNSSIKSFQWRATAPSNIALIKYMGRALDKTPDNVSLSFTLPHLLSVVELELCDLSNTKKSSMWKPLDDKAWPQIALSEKAQNRFLKHLEFLQSLWDDKSLFIVRSSNNFPLSAGLASSASSFAALTLAAVEALSEITKIQKPSLEEIAQLSKLGSGSSCRSIFEPWVIWDNKKVYTINTHTRFQDLCHKVLLLDTSEKEVSSSEAHHRVQTSPLYKGRALRAQTRLNEILLLLQNEDADSWRRLYEIAWDEFEDMHQLFETANPAFSYRTPAVFERLKKIQGYWNKHNDGPIVTMDAGSNIHLLYRPNQENDMLLL